MATYLIEGTYTADGVKGVLKDGGSGRRKAVEDVLKSMGGRLEAMYYAFGDPDVYVIYDAPDNITAAALAMGVGSTGLIAVKTTVLLTIDEIDQAAKKTVSYRAPGR
ncbi:MAG TPA: GYD domain-containing protein [Candidatus Dormibacteraeota bacterium]|nr:GYD domain-containing protein [Candidatus Dormibacteraeota bacterium]